MNEVAAKKSNQPDILKVYSEMSEMRLDRFLRKSIPGIKQGHIEKLIRSGSIRVDKKRIHPNLIIKTNQLVSLPPGLRDNITPNQKIKQYKANSKDIELLKKTLILDQKDCFVLNKPQGLSVQGGEKISRHIDGLLEPAFGCGSRPLLVHRLDRNTSGALLIAKNRQAAKRLATAFKNNNILKMYLAIVIGKPKLNKGEVSFPLIKRNVSNEEKMVVDYHLGLKALTYYQVLASSDKFSFMSLFPITGRTHQLRIHMSEIGCPILGDTKYSDNIDLKIFNKEKIKLQLHCFQLVFPSESNEKILVHADLNNSMKKVLKSFNMLKYIPIKGSAHYY